MEEFSLFTDWMDKYEYLIELGKALPPFPESKKLEENLIPGCQSRVWVDAKFEDGKLLFDADSDAIITKGIISLLIKVFSGHTPQEILEANTQFIDKIGLKEHLSPTRANGLVSMIKQMKAFALAYSEQEATQKNIILALKQVYDPDVMLNVYDLGLIYDIKINKGKVQIVMTFTSPNCPMADFMLQELHQAVQDVPGVTEVGIQVTFDPPWDKSRLSETALLELGML